MEASFHLCMCDLWPLPSSKRVVHPLPQLWVWNGSGPPSTAPPLSGTHSFTSSAEYFIKTGQWCSEEAKAKGAGRSLLVLAQESQKTANSWDRSLSRSLPCWEHWMVFCVHQFRHVPWRTLTLEGLGLSAGSLAVPILAPHGVLGSQISTAASGASERTRRCQQTQAGSNVEWIQPGKMWPLHLGINNQNTNTQVGGDAWNRVQPACIWTGACNVIQ